MSLDAESAAALCVEHFPHPLPSGHLVRAQQLDGTDLWSVNAFDELGRPYAGSFVVVGPDGRVWPFSSNPGIHEYALVVQFLSDAYLRGFASRVEPQRLAHRIRELTEERASHVRLLVEEAGAGQLRTPAPRRLP